MLATLFVCILLYRGFRQLLLKEIAEGSDLIVLPHGSIMYNEKISSGQIILPAGQLSVKVSSSKAKSTSSGK